MAFPQTCFLVVVAVIVVIPISHSNGYLPQFFQCHRNQNCLYLLKTLNDRNLWSQMPSRVKYTFLYSFCGTEHSSPVWERLRCLKKNTFRLLQLKKEKRQSQKELNWNEKHFPGLLLSWINQDQHRQFKELAGGNFFLVWPSISGQAAYTEVVSSLWYRAIATRIKN